MIIYSLKKISSQINKIQIKIKNALKKKKKIEIPSSPNKYIKFKKSEPIVNAITFWKKYWLVSKLATSNVEKKKIKPDDIKAKTLIFFKSVFLKKYRKKILEKRIK